MPNKPRKLLPNMLKKAADALEKVVENVKGNTTFTTEKTEDITHEVVIETSKTLDATEEKVAKLEEDVDAEILETPKKIEEDAD
jgi:uncharacterized protein Yka (UPF0111/DUF47 family)